MITFILVFFGVAAVLGGWFFWPRKVEVESREFGGTVSALPSGIERVEKLKKIKADAEALESSRNNIVVSTTKNDQPRLLFQPTFYPPGFIKATADFLAKHFDIFETIGLGAVSGDEGTQYLVVFAERKSLGAAVNTDMYAKLFVSEVVNGIAFDKHILFLNASAVPITSTSAVASVSELMKKDFTANPFYKKLLSDYEQAIIARNKSTN